MNENRISDMLREWEYRNRYAGVTIKDYLKYTGLTMDQFKGQFRKPAEIQVKLRLALEKIAELEAIEVSEADLTAQYEKYADQYKMDIEKVKEVIPADSLTTDLKVEKAFNLVRDNADVTEVEAKAE